MMRLMAQGQPGGRGRRPCGAGWGGRWLVALVVGLGVSGGAVAQGLPKDILADKYRVLADRALAEQKPLKALAALEQYEGVAPEREWEFLHIYGALLVRFGKTVAEVKKGQALLDEQVKEQLKSGREGEEFDAALLLRHEAAEKLKAFAQAEADRLKAERLKEERLKEERAEAERLAAARRAEELRAGRRFRDCEECPEMVVVPAGTYRMGSPASEEGREDEEGPVHRVTIAQPLAVGVYEVTRGEYARFVSATGHAMGNACRTFKDGKWKERSGVNWRNPGYEQRAEDPVVCVNWADAQAYVRWLSEQTGQGYRLLSEAEWEYVARAGTTTARYWGESEAGQCRYANGADASSFTGGVSCADGHARTAPVGSYEANGFGLYDVLGNVWEWTQDCWNAGYGGAPVDGRAWESGDCSRRVLRGGSWYGTPRGLRAANRYWSTTGDRFDDSGFRLARTLTS